MAQMTPQQVDQLVAAAEADLDIVIQVATDIKKLLPILQPAIKDLVQGGLINDASAGIALLSHIGAIKTLLTASFDSVKSFKV